MLRSMDAIEKVMGFAASDSRSWETDTELAYYRVDPYNGRAYAQHKRYDYSSLSLERYAAIERNVHALHRDFIKKVGLPADEVMKVISRKVLVQTLNTKSSGNTDGSAPTARRGVTLASRGFGGFPIEGSAIRLTSFDASRIEGVSLSWPNFVMHPDVKRIELASKEVIMRGIVQRVSDSSLVGQSLNLVMGIVFRPAKTLEGRLVYLPAMKVVVTPQESRADGLTEAGLEFFADIMTSQPPVLSDDLVDSRED